MGTVKSTAVTPTKKSAGGPWPERSWVGPFLVALSERGIVTEACAAASVSRTPAYELRKEDEEFAAAWDAALEVAADGLESVMHQRLAEPMGNRGSDVLLMFALKAMRPDRYREKVANPMLSNTDIVVTLKLGPDDILARVRASQTDVVEPVTFPVDFVEMPTESADEAGGD